MDNKMKELVDSLGAMAEISGILRESLMAAGFTREEAVSIAKDFLSTTLIQAGFRGTK